MMKNNNFNFSFSGLKTAVLHYIESQKESFVRDHVSDICASFQQAVADVLTLKTFRAAKKFGCKKITLAGGVARNEFLRNEFVEKAKINKLDIFFPSPDFCTDNAAMIGRAGLFHLKNGQTSSFSLDAVPNLTLDSID
jgi:N6-L-threonylcarbamoyladenine synthase